jgi:hypothetical protein
MFKQQRIHNIYIYICISYISTHTYDDTRNVRHCVSLTKLAVPCNPRRDIIRAPHSHKRDCLVCSSRVVSPVDHVDSHLICCQQVDTFRFYVSPLHAIPGRYHHTCRLVFVESNLEVTNVL